MRTRVVIRAMTLADYPHVVALWSRSDGIGLNDSDARPAIALFLRRNRSMSSIAVSQAGALIGAVLCGHDGRRGYLHHLAVDPGYRRQGVAKALIARSFKRLSIAGISRCNIFLFKGNERGRAFWEHIEWTHREQLLVYQKVIGPAARRNRSPC